MTYHLQTLIFLKSDWSLKQAREYLRTHGYKTDVDIKKNTYRFRQLKPKKNIEYKTLIKHVNGKVVYYVFEIY